MGWAVWPAGCREGGRTLQEAPLGFLQSLKGPVVRAQAPSPPLGSCRSPARAQKAQPPRPPSHLVLSPKPPQKCHPDSTTLGFVKVQGNNDAFTVPGKGLRKTLGRGHGVGVRRQGKG